MKTIEEYFEENVSQGERQMHINLDSPCEKYYLVKGGRTGRSVGDLASKCTQIKSAKVRLLEYLNILEFGGRNIHVCHKCKNDSYSDEFVCVNPEHLYFGTASENTLDIDTEIFREIGRKMGPINGAKQFNKQLKKGTHICQQTFECPYCGKVGKGSSMYQWHFDRCKHKKI